MVNDDRVVPLLEKRRALLVVVFVFFFSVLTESRLSGEFDLHGIVVTWQKTITRIGIMGLETTVFGMFIRNIIPNLYVGERRT